MRCISKVDSGLFVGILYFALVGCATHGVSTPDCRSSKGEQCPPNFAVVRDASSQPTKVFRGGQLRDLQQYKYLHDQGITHILKLNGDGAAAREERRLAAIYHIHVDAFAFSAFTIGRRQTCQQVCTAFAYLLDPRNQPVYVHCTAGQDRTGYIIGLYEMYLSKAPEMIMTELAERGHQGISSKLFPQIDRELRKRPPPTCGCDLKWPSGPQ